MPKERASQQVPAQPIQSASADDAHRPQTGQFGARQVTAAPSEAVAPSMQERRRRAEIDGAGGSAKRRRLEATTTVSMSAPGSSAPPAPPGLPAALHAASEIRERASRVESDLLAANALQARSKSEVLTNREWQRLTETCLRIRRDLGICIDEWDESIESLVEGHELGTPETETLGKLWERINDAKRRFDPIDLEYKRTTRRFVIPNPHDSHHDVVLQSRIVPGKVFLPRLERSSAVGGGSHEEILARIRSLPHLDRTVLTDSDGRELFAALRHGFMDVSFLDEELLRTLPTDELRTLIGALYSTEHLGEIPADANPDMAIDRILLKLNGDERSVESAVELLRKFGYRMMAVELARVALVADPGRLEVALSGQPVSFTVLAISVLERHDDELFDLQASALEFVSHAGNLAFEVPGPDGRLRTVRADVEFTQTSFPVSHDDQTWNGIEPEDRIPLFGQEDTRRLGGDVERRVSFLHDLASRCGAETRRVGRALDRTRPTRREVDGPSMRRMQDRLLALDDDRRFLERCARTLEEAGRQVKAAYMDNDGLIDDVGTQRKVATRLALIGHLMGDIVPIMNFPHGSDADIKALDAGIKSLASFADCRDGTLPAIDEDSSFKDWAGIEFRPH